jgi:hypothetical protein
LLVSGRRSQLAELEIGAAAARMAILGSGSV